MFKFFKNFILFFLLSGFFLKTVPMLTGGVFPDSANTDTGGFSVTSGVDFHHTVPNYVRDLLQQTKKNFRDSRILILPDGRFNNYYWGAAGAGDFLIDNVAFKAIYRDFGEGFSGNSSHKILIEKIFLEISSLEKKPNIMSEIALTLKKLRINGILVRLDLNCETSQCRISKSQSLKLGEEFYKNRSVFGEWVLFHDINDKLIKSNLDFVSLEKISNFGFFAKYDSKLKSHFSLNGEDFYYFFNSHTDPPDVLNDKTFGVVLEAPNNGKIYFIHRASIYFIALFIIFSVIVSICFIQIFKAG